MGAKAVGIDILFNEPSTESYYDDLLMSVMESLDMPVVLARLKERDLTEPLRRWKLQGHVDLANDSDGITRRVVPEHSFASVLCAHGVPGSSPFSVPGILRFHGSFNEAWAPKSFQATPLVIKGFKILEEAAKETDPLDPRKLREWLEARKEGIPEEKKLLNGKIVVIGTTAAGTFDVKSTPVGGAEPGMLIHATAVRNLLEGNGVDQVPDYLIFVMALASALLIAWAAWRIELAVLYAAICILLAGLVYFLSGRLMAGGYWLPPVEIITAIFITAAGGVIMNFRAETLRKKEITGLFGRFVSPAVVSALVENPALAHPGGREEICTIFFSDLAGFTSISEKLSPPMLLEVMNEYLESMSRTILEQSGTIDKYIGDAVMAFWNAPLSQPDHAVRACAAAIECERATRDMAKKYLEKYGVEIFTRFGLHTGPVVVGPIGSSSRLDYTVLGDTVNLASRLEGANKNYGTAFLVSQATKDMTGGQFAWRPVDLIRVKGKQEPVAVFELLGFSGDVSGVEQIALDDYLAGYELYRAAQFARAAEYFRLAFEKKTGDSLYRLYMERCARFIDNPPPDDWDGVYTMTTK